MKRWSSCLCVLGLLLSGCSSGTKAPKAMEVITKEEGVQQQKSGTAVETDAIQPADAQWTLACQVFKGPSHVELAKLAKQRATAATGMKGFYVVHEEAVSTLYYGFYRVMSPRQEMGRALTSDEVAEGNRAQRDKTRLQSFESQPGERLFSQVFFSPLEPVDPPAPADWDLRNVDRNKSDGDPSKAFWSLEIGIYKDDPARKKVAVEAVKQLREQGVRDAYFYHGKTASSVCIGAWPRDAVREQEMSVGGTEDATTDLFVTPQRFAPGVSDFVRDAKGKRLATVAPRLEIADPTMLATMRKYPNLAVNGFEIQHKYRRKGTGQEIIKYDESQVVIIKRDEGLLDSPDRQPPVDDQQPLIGLPQMPAGGTGTGGGTLRSLGQ